MVCLMAILFEEKIEAKKIERNSGWASTSVLDIVEVQSKYFIKFPWYQIHYDLWFLRHIFPICFSNFEVKNRVNSEKLRVKYWVRKYPFNNFHGLETWWTTAKAALTVWNWLLWIQTILLQVFMAFNRHVDLFIFSLWTGNRLMKLESVTGNSLIYDENAVKTVHCG